MEKRVRVATYRRISTDEKSQPYSLDAQRDRLAAYAQSQGWQIVADYHDTMSGTTVDRPGLQDALQAARAHRFDVLLVLKVDRLSRTCYATGRVLDTLKEAGVGFVSATEGFDTRTPAGRMFLQMLLSFAEFEAASIRDRVAAGIAKARERGVKLGRKQAVPAYVLDTLRAAHPSVSTYRLWQLVQAEGYRVAYTTVARSLARQAAA
jgi:site-specific DNA recombinase